MHLDRVSVATACFPVAYTARVKAASQGSVLLPSAGGQRDGTPKDPARP